MRKAKPCTSKACGILNVIRTAIGERFDQFEKDGRLFMGLDVSSVNAGIAVLKIVDGRTEFVETDVLSLKRSSKDTDDTILEKRFFLLRERFGQLYAKYNTEKDGRPWEISIEDKIVRAGGAKGVIGSHTLAETLVAARLAASLEFPNTTIRPVNPRSARGGLGLNPRFDTSREETKRQVQAFVKANFSGIQWTNKITDEDRADACIIAFSSLRFALRRDIIEHSLVRQHYSSCHAKELGFSEDRQLSPFQIRKRDEQLSSALSDRMQEWVDDIWLRDNIVEVSRT